MSPRPILLAALFTAAVAVAQDRPAEDTLFTDPAQAAQAPASPDRPAEAALFGEAPDAPDAGATRAAAPDGPAKPLSRDEAQFTGSAATNKFYSREEKEDPLKVGGMLYLRAVGSAAEGNHVSQVGLSAPSLMDGYLDARPSERVRGMVLARLQYDPTLVPGASPLPLPAGATPAANPSIGLDQLWVRFDIARTVFVTAGKQHVKWGASRFWNPTDFLTPERKDPLAPFDARLGATMLKVHVPWEAKGWNFYGIGLLDNAGPANTLGKLGGAARAEVVVGSTEVGADAVYVGGRRPRYGVDLSSALGPIDVYGEVAFRSGADFQVWTLTHEVDWTNPLSAIGAFESKSLTGVQAQASGGLNTTVNYTDKNALTLGVEYFYNPMGVDTRALYPWLLYQNQFQPFYLGQHYAAVYALAAGLPGDLTNVTLSFVTIGNLTDRSFLSRLDAFIRVLSYLSVEAYGSAHYGERGGEFRFALDVPALNLGPGLSSAAIHVPAPMFEIGAGLRVSL